MDVECVGYGLHIVIPDIFQNSMPVHDLVPVLCQELKKLVFFFPQPDIFAVPKDLSGIRNNRKVAEQQSSAWQRGCHSFHGVLDNG